MKFQKKIVTFIRYTNTKVKVEVYSQVSAQWTSKGLNNYNDLPSGLRTIQRWTLAAC